MVEDVFSFWNYQKLSLLEKSESSWWYLIANPLSFNHSKGKEVGFIPILSRVNTLIRSFFLIQSFIVLISSGRCPKTVFYEKSWHWKSQLLRIDAVAKFLKLEALGKALGCTGNTREKGSLPLVQGYGGCHENLRYHASRHRTVNSGWKVPHPNRMEKFIIFGAITCNRWWITESEVRTELVKHVLLSDEITL